jgi:hypothetical protein
VIQLIHHTWVEWRRYSFHASDIDKGDLNAVLRVEVECESCKHLPRAPVYSGNSFNLGLLLDAILRHEILKHNAKTE